MKRGGDGSSMTGVNDREQLRDALDLVDDHDLLSGRSCEELPEAFGAGTQAAVSRRLEQIDEQGARNPLAQPRGFPRPAGTEHEAASVRHLEKSVYKFHYGSQIRNYDSNLLNLDVRNQPSSQRGRRGHHRLGRGLRRHGSGGLERAMPRAIVNTWRSTTNELRPAEKPRSTPGRWAPRSTCCARTPGPSRSSPTSTGTGLFRACASIRRGGSSP